MPVPGLHDAARKGLCCLKFARPPQMIMPDPESSSLRINISLREMLQLQHQDYVLAPYLSALTNLRSRRLVSRFRCGCHGLYVDTGNVKLVEQKVDGEQRFCLACDAATAEDEHQFVLTALHIVRLGTDLTLIFANFFLGTSPFLVFLFYFTRSQGHCHVFA